MPTSPIPSPGEIAEAFLTAWTGGDMPAARALCHENLHFKGPIEEWHRADDHLHALARVAQIVKRVDLHRTLVSGNDVVIVYDLVTETPVGSARIAEWKTIRDGRIAEIRAFFDSHPWRTTGFGASTTKSEA
jgi:ketosteroid isomerase-like protein